MKVSHLTSVHPRYDVRIFEKECVSLATNGYEVSLIVNDERENEEKNGVSIISTGLKKRGRLYRFFWGNRKIYKLAIACDAEIYQIHDPELLFWGMKLYKSGKKVIYDSHEDVPRQILTKHWIPKIFRNSISRCVEIYEGNCAKKFAAVVVPTPFLEARFREKAKKTEQICNFPRLEEFDKTPLWSERKKEVCYIGGISKNRGSEINILMAKKLDIILHLAGKFEGDELEQKVLFNKKNIYYHGLISRRNVIELLYASKVGLVTLAPTPNHLNAFPIKLFEYMAAGIPVVASNFPLWKSIIEEAECGICVQQDNLNQVCDAVKALVENPQLSERMGNNGRQYVEKKYNWGIQEKKLIQLYNSL